MRLVAGLNESSADEPDDWEDVEVVVVLDGSTDGSKEALDSFPRGLPLRVKWQPNRGAAAARNACIEMAGGEIIWFLDDDLLPARGTLRLHRLAHESGETRILLGPCLIPEGHTVPVGVRQWWIDHYAALSAHDWSPRFDQFSVANSSIPADLLRTVGGFDESFSGYGWEDFELGARILARNIPYNYEPDAVAWHFTGTDDRLAFKRQRSIGRTTAEMFMIHPQLADAYFPSDYPRGLVKLLDRLHLRSPRTLRILANAAYLVLPGAERLFGVRAQVVRSLAWEAAFYGGFAEQDPASLSRAMGRPGSKVHPGPSNIPGAHSKSTGA